MTAILKRIDDDRTPLEKTRRIHLVRYAQEHGMAEITEQMPATMIRSLFEKRGITRIDAPIQRLGQPIAQAENKIPQVNADDDLARQFRESQKPVTKPIDKMGINELRAECKARGIKLSRRDNMNTMREKLRGEQNAS